MIFTQSFSVGQVAYTSKTGSNESVTEGVQQPFEVSVIIGVDVSTIKLSLSAYPNPTTDYLTLEIDDNELGELNFELLDVAGKLVQQGQMMGQRTQIALHNLASSTYLLKINNNSNLVKTFSVIKK